MSLIYRFTRLTFLCTTVTVMAVSMAGAQHLRYKTKSKMNLESLGFIGSLLDSELVEEVSISGDVKRVDRKDNSTITDLDAQHMINLDHKHKQYSVVTFDELMQAFKDATSFGQTRPAETSAGEPGGEAPEYTVDFDLRVEDTGKSKKIDGVEAWQKVLIIEAIIEPADEAASDTLPSTALYVINDLWQSDDVPEMAVNDEFNRKMAEILQEDLTQGNMSNVISALMKSDPRVGEAMEKAKEGMAELDGTTILSVMHVVTVPPEKELDLALALGEKEKPKKGGGLGGFLKQAAKAQGVDMGGDDSEEQKEPEQTTLFSMESKTEDISDKERKPDYYMIPDNYEEIEFELPKLVGATQN